MTKFCLWLAATFGIYWYHLEPITEGSMVQKLGMIAIALAFAFIVLTAIKRWCYVDKQSNNKDHPIFNHVIAPVAAICNGMLTAAGTEQLSVQLGLYALATALLLLPDGNLAWFWRSRFGVYLTSLPDSGKLSEKDLQGAKHLAWGVVFVPIIMFYLVGSLHQGMGNLLE